MAEETAEKKARAPRVNLTEQAVGTKDGTQTLVSKNGDRQLWKNDKGKFGVVKIQDNKYVVMVRMGATEELGREVLRTGIVPPKPPPAPKKEKTEKATVKK